MLAVETRGRLGLITLDRPEALNALTHEMVIGVRDALAEWARDDRIAVVAIRGAGERAFCAGGDIVAMRTAVAEGTVAVAAEFFFDEYRLNSQIARFPKPYVAVMDGIVLGGGVGVSAHGSHRVVTERTRIGMPETGIGFTPDVGGSWLLSRGPGEAGTHLALTGQMVGAADAIAVGLADVSVPSERCDELIDALERCTEVDDVDAVVDSLAIDPGDAPLDLIQRDIDAAYRGDNAAVILDRLRASAVAELQEAARTLTQRSPTSIVTTLAALRRAHRLHRLDEALDQEYRVVLRLLDEPDFAEGVRAQLVDKDRQPRWQPPTIDDVDPDRVASFFAPLTDAERARFDTPDWSPQ
ncbi:enoyl-CoA hydratase/isomerase family protein [Microcella sp.]|uniref:enoyl-CoA hydratase/isomerase family protein n=1 Tax=Microcella sp. TaxID=1913979 RepID=UPI00391CEBF9